MTLPARLIVMTSNMRYGGIAADGSRDAAAGTLDALLDAGLGEAGVPRILCMQEAGPRDPAAVEEHLSWMARRLGMDFRPGRSAAIGLTTGLQTAVFWSAEVSRAGWWPPPEAGPRAPWCMLTAGVPGLPCGLDVICGHPSARIPADRTAAGQHIASVACDSIQAGREVLAAGDWNCHGRAGAPGPAALRRMPLKARVTQCVTAGGRITPDFSVDDVLTSATLADLAGVARRDLGDRAAYAPTKDGARLDRGYATPGLAACLARQSLVRARSDHMAVAWRFDLARHPARAGSTAEAAP